MDTPLTTTGPTERRLVDIQSNGGDYGSRQWEHDTQRVIDVLCEIARQLIRLADAYEEVHK